MVTSGTMSRLEGDLESNLSSVSLPKKKKKAVQLHCQCDCYVGKFEDHILGLNRPHGQGLLGQYFLKTVEMCGCSKRLSKEVNDTDRSSN
jgi:hypothetical protein